MNLPPKIPSTAEALERALNLLGNRATGNLKRAKQELIDLVGEYPTPEVATIWKNNLRKKFPQAQDWKFETTVGKIITFTDLGVEVKTKDNTNYSSYQFWFVPYRKISGFTVSMPQKNNFRYHFQNHHCEQYHVQLHLLEEDLDQGFRSNQVICSANTLKHLKNFLIDKIGRA
ncbi:MAG: hypothetical protein F6J90_41380 [Moorea sp. SIOASIH]|uniref:hypothetical protein n=1 Tax=Moorena sp. SIOASIH TaxID=2607817 RepID=UPI0013B9A011|nr:hypothetical protein [Moorena sp. SIOASIH]NEO42428.1 hypothetical protein [Moorena sp. SIOASIH]